MRGIELSPRMVEQMRVKPGADEVPVTIGDMSKTRVPGHFQPVYLVADTIVNVTTQEQQIAVFANAAAHLQPAGTFVLELIVPQLRRVPPGDVARVLGLDQEDVGASRRSTTSLGRWRGRMIGLSLKVASCATLRRIAMCGRPNST
jgi:hypothetical protein